MKTGNRFRPAAMKLMLAATLALIGVFALSGPASAGFSGANGTANCSDLNMADNADHSYFYRDLRSDTVAAMTWTRLNNMDPTDINTTLMSSENSQTDVIVVDNYMTTECGKAWFSQGGGVLASTSCHSIVSTWACDQHFVRVDLGAMDSITINGQRQLACHENGHTVGLTHSDATATCMYGGYPLLSMYYNSTDIAAINANY